MTDRQALDLIWNAMNGSEWNADLWDVVADAVLSTGREPFASPDFTEGN